MVLPTIQLLPHRFSGPARTGSNAQDERCSNDRSADEVEAAIKAASADKHLGTVRRVTDLFLLSADGYSGEQIELFGDVLERLIKTIEIRALADVSARIALAEMSTQLASVKQAPPGVIRRLARQRRDYDRAAGADRNPRG